MTGPDCARCGRPAESHPEIASNTVVARENRGRPTSAMKPVRVMKARSNRRLACGHVPAIGQQIVGTGTGWRRAWTCMACHLADLGEKVKISSEETT